MIPKKQIDTLNWKKTHKPILHSKLAHEVARKVDQYLTHLTVCLRDNKVYSTATYKAHRIAFWMQILKIAGGLARAQ